MEEQRKPTEKAARDSLKTRLFRGAAYSMAGLLVAKLVLIVNSIVSARLLGTENLGIYSIFLNLTNVVALFATLGVSSAVVKFVAEFDKKDPRKLRDVVSISALVVSVCSLIVALVYVLSSRFIAVGVYGNAALQTLILIGSLGMVLGSIISPFVSLVQGFQRIRELNLGRVYVALASVPITFLSIYFLGLSGAAMAGVFNSIVLIVVFWGLIRRLMAEKNLRLKVPRNRPLTKAILNYAFPAFGSALLVVPAILIVTSILVNAQGWEEMGLFRVAQGLSNYLLFVPSAVGVALIPMLSEAHASSPEKISKMVSRVFRIVFFVTLPVALVLVLFSKLIIPTLYGFEYFDAWPALMLMAFSTFLLSAESVIGHLLAGIGKMWQGLGMNAIWMSALIVSTYLLVRDFGAAGLGLAFVIAYIIHTAAQVLYSSRILHVSFEGLYGLAVVASFFFLISILMIVLLEGFLLYALSSILLGVLVLVELSMMTSYEKDTIRERLQWLSRSKE